MNQKRIPLEGQPREFQALLDGKPQPMRHSSAVAAFGEVEGKTWQMCSVLQLVYSAGSWHHEGIVGRYMKNSSGQIVALGKTTHTRRSHGGQAK